MPPHTLPIDVTAGVALEARWDHPADPQAAAVFCHPHPLHGGSMRAPLMEKVTSNLVSRGISVLRFNFRGVGASTGAWDGGVGEVDDVAAVVETASNAVDVPLGIAGWSFGAVMSLRWQAAAGSTLPWVGIAPAVRLEGALRLPDPHDLQPAQRTIIIGDRDQFAGVDEVAAYAAAIGGDVEILEGSDHFFYFREERVSRLVAAALCPSCPPG